ncbi:MAG: MBL fold metallo-hydrolase [Patescibacteria group bacterium]
MPTRSLFQLVVSLLLATLCLLGLWLAVSLPEPSTYVTFLSVGQGDAILISQGKNQVLIDGGRNGKTLLMRLGRHIPFWDRNIETVIATHPDSDHIGGLPDVLEAYTVETVLTTGATSDTETSRIFKEASSKAKLGEQKMFVGGKIAFPYGGELTIEYPRSSFSGNVEETNATSIVGRFQYGETSFLLTGDLAAEETVLLNEKPVTILKAAHHGSKYSTSDAFLDFVQPKEAVISVGKNSYGHPSEDVLRRLRAKNILIRRTDQEGDISYRCDFGGQVCVFAK